jgi:hypothetical protein
VALLLGLEHGGSPVTRRSAKDLSAFESSAFRSPSASRVPYHWKCRRAGILHDATPAVLRGPVAPAYAHEGCLMPPTDRSSTIYVYIDIYTRTAAPLRQRCCEGPWRRRSHTRAGRGRRRRPYGSLRPDSVATDGSLSSTIVLESTIIVHHHCA